MKKTLFALLACASLMPAMAAAIDWTVGSVNAAVCDQDLQPAGNTGAYTFYVIYAPSSNSVALTSTLQNQTFDGFASGEWLSNGWTITSLGSASSVTSSKATWSATDTALTGNTETVPAADFYGVSVYNNEMFLMTNRTGLSSTGKVNFIGGTGSKEYNSFKADATTPEPATATLSLLALAGLASRRRRH